MRLKVSIKTANRLVMVFPFLAHQAPFPESMAWIEDECPGIKQTLYRYSSILKVMNNGSEHLGFVMSKVK
jgi:hypothetical protein